MEIRPISNRNLSDAVKLVADVFMKFEAPDYSEEGVRAFFDTALNNPEFLSRLAVLGAYTDEKLVGIIATRNEGEHIALFFVDGEYQGQGIGRKLFETVLKNSSSRELSVNSSPYAKEIYHHLGFEDANAQQVVTGIRFIPMIYKK